MRLFLVHDHGPSDQDAGVRDRSFHCEAGGTDGLGDDLAGVGQIRFCGAKVDGIGRQRIAELR